MTDITSDAGAKEVPEQPTEEKRRWWVSGLYWLLMAIPALIWEYLKMAVTQIKESRRYLTKSLVAFLFFIVVPIGVTGLTIAVPIAVDQTITPTHESNPEFLNDDLNHVTLREKGVIMMQASYFQLERELDSLWGWTANDYCCLNFWDNRASRQKGVRHATLELMKVLSPSVSKYDDADQEDPNLLDALQNGFSIAPDLWGYWPMAYSEQFYRDGIEHVQEYERRLVSDSNPARINVLTSDLRNILIAIKSRVLGVPFGDLTRRNDNVPWNELDNHVFYAKGAAIVARDELNVIIRAFRDELNKGGIENLEFAIDSLDAAVAFNPWWVERGDRDAMVADHRAKMARYFTEAFNRLHGVSDSPRI